MDTTRRTFVTVIGTLLGLRADAEFGSADEAAADARWGSYQRDERNSGYAPETGSPVTAFEADWGFRTGNRIMEASPAFADGTLYVGSTDRRLYAVDATDGTERWSVDTGAAVRDAPAVTAETVVVATRDREAVGIGRDDGEVRWRTEDRRVRHAPLPVDDAVYLTTTRRVVALEAATGEERWRSAELDDPPTAGPAYGDGRVYVPTRHRLRAIDAETGEVAWTFEAGGDVRVVPTVGDDAVYVGARDGRVYALDAATGDRRWAYATGTDPVASSPALRDGTLYVATFGSGGTHAIDAADGTRVWQFDHGTHRTGGPAAVVSDEVVYVAHTRDLYALDLDTGSEVDSHRLDDRIETTPCLVDGTLYVGSRDHRVYALSGSAERVADFAVTRFALRTDAAATDRGDTAVTVPPGASVTATVLVANEGVAEGEFRATFEVDGEAVAERAVRIPPDGSEQLEFEHRFESPGEYAVGLDGERYGRVAVEEGASTGDGPAHDDGSTHDDGDGPGGSGDAVVDEGVPGFGVPAALVGLGVAALRARTGGDSGSDSASGGRSDGA